MAVKRVSNRFFATNVKDGKSVSAILRSNSTLAQVLMQSGSCVPSWDGDTVPLASLPAIWAWTRIAGVTTKPDAGSVRWYWDGTEITFGSDGASNGDFADVVGGVSKPKFHLGIDGDTSYPSVMDGTSADQKFMPTLYIIRDITNAGNHVLSMTGSFTVSGASMDFTVNTTVRIQESSGSGYFGTLTGIPRLTDDAPETTLEARLYNGSGGSAMANFYTAWYIEGQGLIGEGAASNGVATLKLDTDTITDNAVVRVELYADHSTYGNTSNILATASMSVDDETDEMELQIGAQVYSNGSEIGSGQSNVLLRSGQEVLYTFWMGHRQNPLSPYSGYTKFFAKLTDNTGAVIPVANKPDAVAGTDTEHATLKAYLEANGRVAKADDANFFNITQSAAITIPGTTDTAPGGKLKLSYQYNESHGDGVGGIILAV